MGKKTDTMSRTPGNPFRWIGSTYRKAHAFLTEEPDDTPLSDVLVKSVNDLEGVFYHLDALRKHLFRAIIFLAVCVALSFAFTSRIVDLLAKPIGGIQSLQAIDVTEPISVFMRVALLSGFALAIPYIAFELWLFVAPGISPKARIYGLLSLPLVGVFFMGGMVFAYYFFLPTALPFLLEFMGIATIPRPSTYISFVTRLLFFVGLSFEFPFVIYVLASMGLVRARMLANQWRIAVVVIAVLAAMITPTVDPVSMTLMMAPMLVLYIISIGLAFLAARGRSE
jgi:sec-independent protein translocase protein TatC